MCWIEATQHVGHALKFEFGDRFTPSVILRKATGSWGEGMAPVATISESAATGKKPSAQPGDSASRVHAVQSLMQRLGGPYLKDSALTITLAILVAFLLEHLWNLRIALSWLAACVVIDTLVAPARARATAGTYPPLKTLASELAAATIWCLAGLLMFLSGQQWAMLAGLATATAVAIRVVFMGPTRPRDMMIALIPSTLYLVCTMIYICWKQLPPLYAAPASLACLGVVASVAHGAKLMIAQRRRLEAVVADLRATHERLAFAVESVSDASFELDTQTMTYRRAPKLNRLLGYQDEELVYNDANDRVHPDDHAMVDGAVNQALAGGPQVWSHDVRLRCADGSYRWLNVRAGLFRAGDGAGRIIGLVTDLSQHKALEAELRAARDSAEAASRSKSEFLANMSHEIRTPLNGVLGMAQALDADALDPGQREKVATILDSGKSLMALLNDVLDLSKIEAGKLEIAPTAGDLLHTMRRTRQLFQSQAEEKGLQLSARVDANLPQRMVYDAVRVRQCVSNLLSNAVKFTARGRIDMAIAAEPLPDGAYMVSIRVSDTGIGISPEAMSRLFSLFTQADNSTTRRFGGTGLGLHISRQLARMMGGDLVAVSQAGRGSTFTLTFRALAAAADAAPAPRQTAAQSPIQSPAHPPVGTLRGVRVLLTDDNATNRQVIKLFLAPHGCDLVEATNGKEALDRLSSQPFDIVLLDVHMPVMDGKEAVQRIRSARQAWARLPVIALTADAMTGDRERYLALGMSDYVSKPVDQRELIAKMLQQLGGAAPTAARKGA